MAESGGEYAGPALAVGLGKSRPSGKACSTLVPAIYNRNIHE
jgi:hypothetical protein